MPPMYIATWRPAVRTITATRYHLLLRLLRILRSVRDQMTYGEPWEYRPYLNIFVVCPVRVVSYELAP